MLCFQGLVRLGQLNKFWIGILKMKRCKSLFGLDTGDRWDFWNFIILIILLEAFRFQNKPLFINFPRRDDLGLLAAAHGR